MDKTATLDIRLFGNDSDDQGFYVNRLSEHLKTAHLHISRPHKHDFYVFVFFTSGNGKHDIDFTHYEVQPGSIFIMLPGQTHNWKLSDDAEGFVFFHTAEFYALRYGNESIRDYPFFASLSNARHIVAGKDEALGLSRICEDMYAEFIATAAFRDRMIGGLMTAAYIKTTRLITASETKNTNASPLYQTKFQAFEQLVDQHFKETKSAVEYADKLHITPKHLNRICQTVAGKMTTEIILERVILEAKRMLTWSHDPLSDIALALGYEDYAYFSKLFKKKTGKTPSEFVKNMGHHG